MLCYLKFHFKQHFCGEERQYTTSPFLFYLTKPSYLIMVLIKMRFINLDF